MSHLLEYANSLLFHRVKFYRSSETQELLSTQGLGLCRSHPVKDMF